MTNIAKHNQAPSEKEALLTGITRLGRCCERITREISAHTRLSEAQCAFLQAAPADRSIVNGELCRQVGLSPSRGSRVIDELVQGGWVDRAADPADRRIIRLMLSPTGRALKDEIAALAARCEATLTSQLNEAELATVKAGMTLLLNAMEHV